MTARTHSPGRRLPGRPRLRDHSRGRRLLREVVVRVDRGDLDVGFDDVADHEGAGVLAHLAEEVLLLLGAQVVDREDQITRSQGPSGSGSSIRASWTSS